ncbi:L,D-transpeptidase [Solirubrobacter phytolaccae]|uniref:L,D-transpeptidase n=1 Tax=Solirubrobacter phytolaccae TaxID=1404360 RepID=A0A9X3SAK5_9ACTN|nr:L,D-transpeptidase [Solirubrobacter phytolaccae]MDA0180365.1 L,D-transpeptidase [Solirubrobacter phytolaccae]
MARQHHGRRVVAIVASAAVLFGCGEQRPPLAVAEPTGTTVAVAWPQLHETADAVAPGVETVWLRRRSVTVHATPGGRRVTSVRSRTPYGSRTRLWVQERSGAWLKVAALDTSSGVGWIEERRTKPARNVARRVVIDRSAQRLTVYGGARTWSTRVVVGAAGTPTPLGSYQVTDRLRGERFGGTYGAWVLALSAFGTPARTSRLAVHGIPPAARPGTGSAGCVRVPLRALRRLAREIVPGTPVRIRA